MPLKYKLTPGVDVVRVQVKCCRECANCRILGKSDKGAVQVVCTERQWDGRNGGTREITTVIRNSSGLLMYAVRCQYFDPLEDEGAPEDWWRQSYGTYLNMRQWVRKAIRDEPDTWPEMGMYGGYWGDCGKGFTDRQTG